MESGRNSDTAGFRRNFEARAIFSSIERRNNEVNICGGNGENDAVTSLHRCTPDAALGAPTFVCRHPELSAAGDVTGSSRSRFHENNDVMVSGP